MSWNSMDFCYNCKRETPDHDYIRSVGPTVVKYNGCKYCGCPYGTFREAYNRTNILNLKKQEAQNGQEGSNSMA